MENPLYPCQKSIHLPWVSVDFSRKSQKRVFSSLPPLVAASSGPSLLVIAEKRRSHGCLSNLCSVSHARLWQEGTALPKQNDSKNLWTEETCWKCSKRVTMTANWRNERSGDNLNEKMLGHFLRFLFLSIFFFQKMPVREACIVSVVGPCGWIIVVVY